MKKNLSLTTIALLVLMLFIPIMALDYGTSTVDGVSVRGGDYEFDLETPLGSAPNVIGSETYQDIEVEIEAPLTPTGLISTAAAQTNDSNAMILIGISAISLAGVCIIAIKSKKKNNI